MIRRFLPPPRAAAVPRTPPTPPPTFHPSPPPNYFIFPSLFPSFLRRLPPPPPPIPGIGPPPKNLLRRFFEWHPITSRVKNMGADVILLFFLFSALYSTVGVGDVKVKNLEDMLHFLVRLRKEMRKARESWYLGDMKTETQGSLKRIEEALKRIETGIETGKTGKSIVKDLLVPAQWPAPPINRDPAIILSLPGTTTSSSWPPTTATGFGSGSLTDVSSLNSQLGHHPGSTFQGGLPLYQPGGNMVSWVPSPPPPNANGCGLAMLMYWPGFYGLPTGLPQMHQQSLLRPPPGLSIISSMLQPLHYPGFNGSLPAGASNFPTPNLPTSTSSDFPSFNIPNSNLPEYPSQLLPATASSPVLNSKSFTGSSLPSSVPSFPPSNLSSEALPSMVTIKSPNTVGPTAPISKKPNLISGPALLYQGISHPISSNVGTSANQTEFPTPSPGQLLPSGQGAVHSSQSSQMAHKDAEVVQVAPTPSSRLMAPALVQTEAQPPILPLPTPSRSVQKASHPVTKFTEEFDFTAMNEMFNKDEVWGHLGKSNKQIISKDKGDGVVTEEEKYKNDAEIPTLRCQACLYQGLFLDYLSSNALIT